LNGEGVGHGVHPVVATATLTGQLIIGAISAVRQTQPGEAATNWPGTTPVVASPAGWIFQRSDKSLVESRYSFFTAVEEVWKVPCTLNCTVLSGALRPAIVPIAVGVHWGVGVLVTVTPLVGIGVGTGVGGDPGHTARLISENGGDEGVEAPPPPPQLNSNAAAKKVMTGTSTTDLRNQIIEPCTMPTRCDGVKLRVESLP